MKKRFKTALRSEGPDSLFIELPFDPRDVFGQVRAKVKVNLRDYTYRSTVAAYGGHFFLPVRKSHREAAKVRAGDEVTVTMALLLEDAPSAKTRLQ